MSRGVRLQGRPLAPLTSSPEACAVRQPVCVDEHCHWRFHSRANDAQHATVNRYMPRLGVVGFARALGTSVRTVDAWVCSGVRPERAADLAARLHLLVMHELEAAGRCDCRACLPSSGERFAVRVDARSRERRGRVALGRSGWCLGTSPRLEVCA